MGRLRTGLAVATAFAMASCREAPSLPAHWIVLHEDFRARVALDTAQIAAAGDSGAVHLRYDLKTGLPLPDGSGSYHALETIEIPECEAETARIRSAVLFDSVGHEVGRIETVVLDSVPPQRSIGLGGPPLCRFLRERGLLR